MDFIMFQEAFQLIHRAVEYIKGEPTHCPICARFGLGQFRLVVYSSKGDGLRYARCANCGHNFKTVEKIVACRIPETLAVSATVTYSKGRKRRKK